MVVVKMVPTNPHVIKDGYLEKEPTLIAREIFEKDRAKRIEKKFYEGLTGGLGRSVYTRSLYVGVSGPSDDVQRSWVPWSHGPMVHKHPTTYGALEVLLAPC
ncbi:hypothetical protein HZH66_013619 [Vespula vulgaris]|uniref:Uncharacterized protein n=1 Tax=Vespula vulgaris TaxID=7454 RepID=A0A834MR13_VESVU|nr:hypothetical protein HZH66_013619 [Vespula vulgaris]